MDMKTPRKHSSRPTRQTGRSRHSRYSRHHQGAVMAEMIFSIPLLLVVLFLMMGMGRGFERKVQVTKAARYETWRIASRNVIHPNGDLRTGPSINTSFYKGKATAIDVSTGSGFNQDAEELLKEETSILDNRTGEMATQALDSFPRGVTSRVQASFPEGTNRIWKLFDDDVRDSCNRMSHEWKHANHWLNLHNQGISEREIYCYRGHDHHYWHIGYMDPRYENLTIRRANWGGPWMLVSARDTYLVELDGQMESLDQGGNYIAHNIREMYTQRPRYRGHGFPFGIYYPGTVCGGS